MAALVEARVPFLVGGGFAFAAFTGRWRDTKDIDLYVEPAFRDRAIFALSEAGFSDYFKKRGYDRRWIFRSTRAGVIVDIIWAMANQRAQVDASWFARSPRFSIRGQELRLVPVEEMIWCKLYVVQRDRCDWTDVFNLVYGAGDRLDWAVLRKRLGSDGPLLQAMLGVYQWLCPGPAQSLPPKLRRELGLEEIPRTVVKVRRDRVRLLDSRAWFAPLQPPLRKLEI
jgi:hypothetical protein